MPYAGRPPKDNRVNRMPIVDYTDVPDVPYAGPSPDLPALADGEWLDMVVRWWEVVRHMPHCCLWTEGDWIFAVETAHMKQQYWTNFFWGKDATQQNTAFVREIRSREATMGTNTDAIRKNRIRYVDPNRKPLTSSENLFDEVDEETGEPRAGTVTPLSSRRRRLTG